MGHCRKGHRAELASEANPLPSSVLADPKQPWAQKIIVAYCQRCQVSHGPIASATATGISSFVQLLAYSRNLSIRSQGARMARFLNSFLRPWWAEVSRRAPCTPCLDT